MNGQVVKLADTIKQEEIQSEADRLFKIFYDGDELTEFERDLERRYLSEKYKKFDI